MPLPISRRLDFAEIPQIDVGPLLEGTPSADGIDELARACRDVGFFYVRNHGVAPALIARLHAATKRFFERDMAFKMRTPIDGRMTGYLPLNYASYEGEARAAKSRQEGFWVGYERPIDAGRQFDGPNQWPEGHDDLKEVMTEYMAAVERLTLALLHGFSLALGLDGAALGTYFAKPITRLKLNHYPPQINPETLAYIGVVSHTDSGAFTILWQDDGDGLEIQNKSGEWVGAPSIPNTFVVNIANVMQMWSNGQFSSTPHRVINRNNRDRYSIPVFVLPDHDAVIKPMVGAEAGAEEVEFRDYLREIWKKAFPIAGIK
jgi:isopenicillin N synthase-like dioxygenase